MLMFHLNETNSVCWYGHKLRGDGHELRREDGLLLGNTFDFEDRLKEGTKPEDDMEEAGDVESMRIGLTREDALCR